MIADDDPDITARVDRSDFGRWEQQLANSGHCAHPIRLRGRTRAINLETGEIRTTYDTAGEPDGVLLTACGNTDRLSLPRSRPHRQPHRWHHWS